MFKRIAVMAFIVTLAAVPAFAQKAEVGVTFGWVYADGVSGNTYIVPGVGSFSRVDPKDSFGWGIDVGFFIGPNAEVGFLYGNQPTTLQVSGTAVRDVGDMSISTYHGTYTYNFGESDAAVRPYLTVGLGATNFGGVSYSTPNRTGTTQGATRFSSTWGAGAKFYGASKVGARVGRALDTGVHQVRRGRLLVRPVLGLLPRRQRPVREPAGTARRHHLPLLTPRLVSGSSGLPRGRPEGLHYDRNITTTETSRTARPTRYRESPPRPRAG